MSDEISPRVRRVVQLLRSAHLTTTDSGDGSNHAAGMECAVPFPMVAIKTSPALAYDDLRRARHLLTMAGVKFTPEGQPGPTIMLTVDGADNSSVILITDVTDDLLS